MSILPKQPTYTSVTYAEATNTLREQIITSTRGAIQSLFPHLSEEQWQYVFYACQPRIISDGTMICLDEASLRQVVAYLMVFHTGTEDSMPPGYTAMDLYLARLLEGYRKMADHILRQFTAPDMLTSWPDGVESLLRALASDNVRVAEVLHAFTKHSDDSSLSSQRK